MTRKPHNGRPTPNRAPHRTLHEGRHADSPVHLHIAEIVLDGAEFASLAPDDAERLRRAVTLALENRLRERPPRVSGHVLSNVDGGDIAWLAKQGPESLGRRIAGAVHGALRPVPREPNAAQTNYPTTPSARKP